MPLFWWLQLPLLILIQLLQSSYISLNAYAQPSLVSKHKITELINCNKAAESGVLSLRIDSPIGGDIDVPSLTPLQESDVKKASKQKFAAIISGTGATLLVLLIVVLVCICLMRIKRFVHQTPETVSSSHSPPAAQERVKNSSCTGTQNLRQFTLLEIEHATNYFSQNNQIGEGLFGLVYRGLLQDGSIVAVKRRMHTQNQSFVHEVNRIAQVHHRNLVQLIGYYEDSHQQILVFDNVHYGNVGHHLYDSEGLPVGRLNLQQRLLIALDAAKGLEHLNSLVPPLLHMHFRTRNVLLDENFRAKVSDYGLSRLIPDDHRAGPSSTLDCFLDPELNISKNYTAGSDVYSYGVFLLELISGQEASSRNQQNLDQTILLQAKNCEDYAGFADESLAEEAMQVVEEMMELALQCIDIVPRRPMMRNIVSKLEEIEERELGNLYSEFEVEIGAVTLGSELFK